MFSSLVNNKNNNLFNRVSEHAIIFAKTLNEEAEWIITSKSLIDYFDKTIEEKFYANNLVDAINHILEEETKSINIVAHGSAGFIDLGNGYNSFTLEKEFSSLKNFRTLNEPQINLWSCYGGSINGIKDSLERCLNLKVNASNGELGKGNSLSRIMHSKLKDLITNLTKNFGINIEFLHWNFFDHYRSNSKSGFKSFDAKRFIVTFNNKNEIIS